MFGHYFRKLDEKNRVIIPSKLKKDLGDTFYITIGMDDILEIRNEKEFSIFKDKLLGANLLNANARKFARILLGRTLEIKPDGQGRMSLPDEFMKASDLTKDVAFVGVGNKVELWSKKAFEKFQSGFDSEGSIDDLAKKLLADGVEL